MAFLNQVINFLFGFKNQTEKKYNSQKSGIDAAIERANELASLINKLLRSTNESSNINDREVNLAIVRTQLQEIKKISAKYPAIQLQDLDKFETSIEGVAAETLDLKRGLKPQSNIENQRTFSDNDNNAVLESINSHFRVINESIDIARKSKNLDTTESRLQVARNTLNRARETASQFLLNIDGFDEAEAEIDRITKAIKTGTPKVVEGIREIEPDPYFSNPSRTLLKEATALKKEKRYIEACDKLRVAYLAEGSETLMIEDRLRLPMYLQLAGKNDEGWAELNQLLKNYNDQFSNQTILNQMKVFLKKENNQDATNSIRVIESVDVPKSSTINSNWLEASQNNLDIITGYEFCATMQLRTPLRVLKRHGEIHSNINTKPEQIAKEEWEGIWYPKMATWRELGADIDEMEESTMASNIGQIKASEYLPFLISVREILELNESIDSRINMMRNKPMTEKWKTYISMHGGIDNIINQFFPRFIDTVPKLNKTTIDELSKLGIDTANKLESANDTTLMGINGIGKAKLKTMRDYCASIKKNRDEVRLDNVTG